MSKTATLKKALTLLSMGGATFLLGFGFDGAGRGVAGMSGCVTNGDLVTFYQTVGGEGIAAFEDATATNLFGQDSDFDKMVIEPTATFWTAMWDNEVANDFPLDVGVGDWLQ